MDEQSQSAEFQRALVAAYPDLLRCAERLTGNRAEAWDLVHETMERGLRYRARFQRGDRPNGWLVTILRRLFIDRCRRARVALQLSRRWDREGVAAVEEPAPAPPWEAFSVEDVRRALMFLAPSFQTPYALFAFDRLSYAEIGSRLCLPAGTIATRVFRARQKLRELLTSGEFRLRPVARPDSITESGRPAPLAPAEARQAARRGRAARYRARSLAPGRAPAVARFTSETP